MGVIYQWACPSTWPQAMLRNSAVSESHANWTKKTVARRSQRARKSANRMGQEGMKVEKLTAPEVALSWVDLPVTLKATLLGVLPLNSKVEADPW